MVTSGCCSKMAANRRAPRAAAGVAQHGGPSNPYTAASTPGRAGPPRVRVVDADQPVVARHPLVDLDGGAGREHACGPQQGERLGGDLHGGGHEALDVGRHGGGLGGPVGGGFGGGGGLGGGGGDDGHRCLRRSMRSGGASGQVAAAVSGRVARPGPPRSRGRTSSPTRYASSRWGTPARMKASTPRAISSSRRSATAA